jgi:hypothetical protein
MGPRHRLLTVVVGTRCRSLTVVLGPFYLLGGGYGPSSPFVDLVMVPRYRSWMVAGAGLAVHGWWQALVAVR